MTHEQEPQLRKAETPEDFHALTKAMLEAVANNSTGALGGQIIAAVQASTGYEPAAVAAVFMELGNQGVVERSFTDPMAGVVLTQAGQRVYQNYDHLMGLDHSS
jgi:hypothetical protein